MSKSVVITGTTLGTETGPFDIYHTSVDVSNLLGTGYSRTALLAGVQVDNVPDEAIVYIAQSTGAVCENYGSTANVDPSPTPTITKTISITPSITGSTPGGSPSITPSITPSLSLSQTPTVTVSLSVTPSITPSISPSSGVSATPTPTVTVSGTPTVTSTPTMTSTQSIVITQSPTTTPTPTKTSTPTITSTPTPTVTSGPLLNTCSVLVNGNDGFVYAYDLPSNTATQLSIPSLTYSADMAHTQSKMFMIVGGGYTLRVWNITLSPFTATFSADYTLPYITSAGLHAKSNSVVILVKSNITPHKVIEMDISSGSPVFTDKFNLQVGRVVTGDYILTEGISPKLIITNYQGSTHYVSQYDYTTGALEVDFEITSIASSAYGIFAANDGTGNKLYLMNSSDGKVYRIDLTSPYGLTYIKTANVSISGASQVPGAGCISINLVPPSPTVTTTPTPTPTPSQLAGSCYAMPLGFGTSIGEACADAAGTPYTYYANIELFSSTTKIWLLGDCTSAPGPGYYAENATGKWRYWNGSAFSSGGFC